MSGEKFNSTLPDVRLDYEISTPEEPQIKINQVAQFAGELVMLSFMSSAGVPVDELLTLKAAMATTKTAELITDKKYADK